MKYIDFYKQYKDKIFSYFFYNLKNNRELAEDLTSDTFLKGFEKIESYDSSFQFSTWIFRIARNTLYDYYRKEKIDIQIDDETEGVFTEFFKYEEDFNKKIDSDLKMKEVYKAINKIPENQKEIIIMKYLEDFSTKEISNMTGKTEANIRKILSRGFSNLTKILKPLSQ